MIAHASAPFPLCHALDHSPGLPLHFSDRIPKKPVRPVLDATVLVHFKPLQFSAFFPSFHEVQSTVFGRNLLVGDERLQPAKHILGVSLHEELNSPGSRHLHEKVGQRRLGEGMQVDFRLLHDDGRSFRHKIRERYNRQNLGDAKTHIDEIRLDLALMNDHLVMNR